MHKNEFNLIIFGITRRRSMNMYVTLEIVKEETILHFFFLCFIIFKMQLSEDKWTKNINITFGLYLWKKLH